MSKIINDPVHGFIDLKSPLILDLIAHPYFQRLRNIQQLGLTHYVYPGATHSRFLHALGAFHLMHEALSSLKNKGVLISEAEAEAAGIAILLHDIGHGPFSHTLEHAILRGISHETISKRLMHKLNGEFQGKLSLAIEMFENKYERPFFYQLISSQLDVDRLDYLTRDSFFTGVKEGNVSVDRILKMLQIKDNQLVVEEKGILSVESYLIARKIMYWQVYLHKTVLSVEYMLIKVFERLNELNNRGKIVATHTALDYFLNQKTAMVLNDEVLAHFVSLSDSDVWQMLKNLTKHADSVLNKLSNGILNRHLYHSKGSAEAFSNEMPERIQKLPQDEIPYFFFQIKIEQTTYSKSNPIQILCKDGSQREFRQYAQEYGLGKIKSGISRHYQFSFLKYT